MNIYIILKKNHKLIRFRFETKEENHGTCIFWIFSFKDCTLQNKTKNTLPTGTNKQRKKMSNNDGGDEHAADRDVDQEAHNSTTVLRMMVLRITGGGEILPRWRRNIR